MGVDQFVELCWEARRKLCVPAVSAGSRGRGQHWGTVVCGRFLKTTIVAVGNNHIPDNVNATPGQLERLKREKKTDRPRRR